MQVLQELSGLLEASIEKLVLLEQYTIREINSKKSKDSSSPSSVDAVKVEKDINEDAPVNERSFDNDIPNYLEKHEKLVSIAKNVNASNVLISQNSKQNECSIGKFDGLVQSKVDSCQTVSLKRELPVSEVNLKVSQYDNETIVACKKKRTSDITDTLDSSFSTENVINVFQALSNREEESTLFINSIGIKAEVTKSLPEEATFSTTDTDSVESKILPSLHAIPEANMFKAEARFKVCHSYEDIEKSLEFAGSVEDLVISKNKVIVTFSDSSSLEALVTQGKSKLQEMKLMSIEIIGNKIRLERLEKHCKKSIR